MAILKFWLDVFGKMVDAGGVFVTLQYLLSIKRVLALSISNRMSSFRSLAFLWEKTIDFVQ